MKEDSNIEKQEEINVEENPQLSFDELGLVFDKNFTLAKSLIRDLSKKSLQRVLLKILAYPLQSDKISLFQGGEEPVYNVGISIQQIKTNMMIEQLRLEHEAHAEELIKERTNETKES